MSRVSELIDLIVQGKNTEATEVLNQELLTRSYDGINQMKPEVASEYFSSVVEMPNDGEPEADYDPEEPQPEDTQDETD